MSQEAFDRIQRRTRAAWIAVGAAVLSVILAFVLDALPGLIWLGLAGMLFAVVAGVAANWATVGMSLDASRRWVTLSGVHPDFVAAVRAEGARERADLQY